MSGFWRAVGEFGLREDCGVCGEDRVAYIGAIFTPRACILGNKALFPGRAGVASYGFLDSEAFSQGLELDLHWVAFWLGGTECIGSKDDLVLSEVLAIRGPPRLPFKTTLESLPGKTGLDTREKKDLL